MSIAAKHSYRFGYLKSEEWQYVRAQVLADCGAKCFVCGLESIHNDVHHKRYPKNIWDTKAGDCVSLCRPCHEKVHLLINHGVTLDSDQILRKLRKFVSDERERERKANKLAEEKRRRDQEISRKKSQPKGPRCVACHTSELPLSHHAIDGIRVIESVLWCSECWKCWEAYPKPLVMKWAYLRSFLDERRDFKIKSLFDSVMVA